MKQTLSKILLYAVLIAMAVAFLFPFYWLVISSAKSRACYAMTPPTFYPAAQKVVSIKANTTGRVFRIDKGLWFLLTQSKNLLVKKSDRNGAYFLSLSGGVSTQSIKWFPDGKKQPVQFPSKTLAFDNMPVDRLTTTGLEVAVIAKMLRTQGSSYDELLFYTNVKQPSLDTVKLARNPVYTQVLEWAPRWKNFTETWNGPSSTIGAGESTGFFLFLRNSLFIAVMAVIGQIFGSSLAAYAFARLRFKWRELLFIIVLATMMIPVQVTLIPMFTIYKYLGWLDSFLPLIVPYFCGSAFSIFLIRQYMLGMPKELDEAAAVDGCGLFRTYFRVILPNCIPILVVVGIFTFVGSWQDVLGPLIYLNSPHLRTVPLGLEYFRSPYVDNRNLLMTGSLLAMLPVGLLFIFFQRYIMAGIASTGVKG